MFLPLSVGLSVSRMSQKDVDEFCDIFERVECVTRSTSKIVSISRGCLENWGAVGPRPLRRRHASVSRVPSIGIDMDRSVTYHFLLATMELYCRPIVSKI